MKEKRETVYVKAERNSVCLDPQIRIMDVMSVECTDPAICIHGVGGHTDG